MLVGLKEMCYNIYENIYKIRYDKVIERRVRMRNIKIVIEYDGKSFNGWQKQPDKLNIQGEIENAIEQVTGEKVELTASRKN